MELVDRIALVITPKRRFLEWANSLPAADAPLTIEEAKSLRSVVLVAVDEADLETEDLIDMYHPPLFQELLASWTPDESWWPVNRNAHVFRDWFQVEAITHVMDADPGEEILVSERELTRCAACREILEQDAIVFVGFGEGAARRLTAEEAERCEEELVHAGEPGGEMPSTLVIRCCSVECAAGMEAAYARAVAASPDAS